MMHENTLEHWLQKHKIHFGSQVTIQLTTGESWEGQLESSDDGMPECALTLRLQSGHCIALTCSMIQSISERGWSTQKAPTSHPAFSYPLAVLTQKHVTGKVIALYIGPEEHFWHDFLESQATQVECLQETVIWTHCVQDKDILPAHCVELSHQLYRLLQHEPTGITLHISSEYVCSLSTALSWMLQALPIPIICIGLSRWKHIISSQRNSLEHHIWNTIQTLDAGAVLIGSPTSSSDSCSLLFPTRTRRSTRLLWESLEFPPAFIWKTEGWEMCNAQLQPRLKTRTSLLNPGFIESVLFLQPYLGYSPEYIQAQLETIPKGVILACHLEEPIPYEWMPSIQWLCSHDIPTFAVSQFHTEPCVLQSTSRGRQLLQWGVHDLGWMLPEVACSKLSWLLSQSENTSYIRNRMKENLCGEHNTYRNVGGSKSRQTQDDTPQEWPPTNSSL